MFGFMFGEVVYLSDVNGIPDKTRERIHGCGLLIIDMLRMTVLANLTITITFVYIYTDDPDPLTWT